MGLYHRLLISGMTTAHLCQTLAKAVIAGQQYIGQRREAPVSVVVRYCSGGLRRRFFVLKAVYTLRKDVLAVPFTESWGLKAMLETHHTLNECRFRSEFYQQDGAMVQWLSKLWEVTREEEVHLLRLRTTALDRISGCTEASITGEVVTVRR